MHTLKVSISVARVTAEKQLYTLDIYRRKLCLVITVTCIEDLTSDTVEW